MAYERVLIQLIYANYVLIVCSRELLHVAAGSTVWTTAELRQVSGVWR